MGVLMMRAYYSGCILGPVILGNSHVSMHWGSFLWVSVLRANRRAQAPLGRLIENVG